jgi:TPR repeat protein
MARFDIASFDAAGLGAAPVANDIFFELGMKYSVGNTVATDFVSAHKWFNLAAMRGNQDAIRLRREVAEQMSDTEIAAAQRAARDWLRAN